MTRAAILRSASILFLLLDGGLLLLLLAFLLFFSAFLFDDPNETTSAFAMLALLLACIGLSGLGTLAAIRAVSRRDARFPACSCFCLATVSVLIWGTLHFLMR